jgi:hypothetical protein
MRMISEICARPHHRGEIRTGSVAHFPHGRGYSGSNQLAAPIPCGSRSSTAALTGGAGVAAPADARARRGGQAGLTEFREEVNG